jgi:predicted transcriptional regulator
MIGKSRARMRPTFRASRSGIAQVLGDLEREIMEALWRQGESATVTETVSQMGGESRAYHTVTTVMVRLCEKRLLQRRRRGGVWHYSPLLSRDEFKRQVAEEVIAGVYALAPESAVNSLLDLVDASHPKGLEELASLVEQKRRERRGKK